MVKVAFFDAKPYDKASFSKISDLYDFKIKFFETKLTPDSVKLSQGYDVVCAFVNDNLSKEVIDSLYNLGIKLIALRCAGYNNVDFKAAYGKIHVVRVPAYSPYAVAEHAFALLMALNRKTHRAYNRTRENNFSIAGLTGFDLNGKNLGIIGMGKIGRIVAKIGLGFGMNILAYDKFANNIDNVKFVELDQLYSESDVISLHCPLTPDTHHIINKNSIDMMKNGIVLINTSRGGLIDTKALIDGIKKKKISAAGLDVYEEESDYFFEDFSSEVLPDDKLARLLSFNNVLITSHQAFLTEEALTNIAKTTLDNIKDYFDEKPLLNEICYQCIKDSKGCDHNHKQRCF